MWGETAAPMRRFTDEAGYVWSVRMFTPSTPPALLSEEHARGWLTFEREDGERRRLVPAPADWHSLPDHALVRALAGARPVARAESMRQLFADQGWAELDV